MKNKDKDKSKEKEIEFTPDYESGVNITASFRQKCKVCGQCPTERLSLYNDNEDDLILVREYIDDHETMHLDHTVDPVWKECCGALKYYKVTLKKLEKVR